MGQQTAPAPSVVSASLQISDESVDVPGLHQHLSAADTFLLDHLADDDTTPFPTYEPEEAPDHVPSQVQVVSETVRSPGMRHLQRPSSSPSPDRIRSNAPYVPSLSGPSVQVAMPAPPHGSTHPPSGFPRCAPATAPAPSLAPVPPTPFLALASRNTEAQSVTFRGPPGDCYYVPQHHSLATPYYRLSEPRARIRSPMSRKIIVESDLNWDYRDPLPY
jgi:hypothetical protein